MLYKIDVEISDDDWRDALTIYTGGTVYSPDRELPTGEDDDKKLPDGDEKTIEFESDDDDYLIW